ncbi:MAG: acylphosphatase [Sphaerochaetaceae bacterium]|nr:acylphosphatase [Sphaerochaetaceae bacterium]
MGESNTARWHIYFSGRVQHVGFRYTAYYFCKALYLTGWVKNLPDGRVEMEVQGSLSSLRKFLLQIKSVNHIHIDKALVNEIPEEPHERKFRVL